ncbi:MAG: hypothetical protein HFH28_11555 [Clostridiaceae bacterium]|nr:hypothetical protein [Clostridiaceae bacterium]
MFLLKGFIVVIIIFFVPFLLGNLICYKGSPGIADTPVPRFLIGLFASLALFWVLCVPLALLKCSFTALVIIYAIIVVILCIISIWVSFHEKPWRQFAFQWEGIRPRGFEMGYLALFFLLLGIQLYFTIFYESTVWSYDDYAYVVSSLDAITSDHMYMTDPISGNNIAFSYKRVLISWDIYIAFLSKVSGVSVTTIAHTIIPAAFLLIAYLVYSYLAAQLFEKRENQLIFMCILSAAFIFGLYSPYSLTFRLLVTLWQGKAVLSTVVIPFLFGFLPKVYTQEKQRRVYLYLMIISMAACSFTMMGSGMSIAVYVAMVVVISLYQRRITGLKYCICGCTVPAIQILLYLILR